MIQDKKWIKVPKWPVFEIYFSGNTSVFVSITETIWQTFDVIIDDPYLTEQKDSTNVWGQNNLGTKNIFHNKAKINQL